MVYVGSGWAFDDIDECAWICETENNSSPNRLCKSIVSDNYICYFNVLCRKTKAVIPHIRRYKCEIAPCLRPQIKQNIVEIQVFSAYFVLMRFVRLSYSVRACSLVFVCVCVCVRERERQREREGPL